MKHRRLLTLLVTAMLVVVTVFPPATALAAADLSTIAVTTHQSMRITTASGSKITPDALGNYTNVPKDAKLYVEYAFSLPNDNGLDPANPSYLEYHYYAGDYLDVQLPYAVTFSEPTGGWNVLDQDNNVMGTLTIDADGLARIVFSDYVEKHSSIMGWFNLDGSFKEGIFGGGDPVEIEVAFAGTTVDIAFHDDRPPFAIPAGKTGVYDAETNRILWNVTVSPNRATDNVTVVDTFSNNQTYVPGSFKQGTTAIDDGDLTIAPGSTTTQITYAGLSLPSGDTHFSYQTEPTDTAFAAETGSAKSVKFTNDVAVSQDGHPYGSSNATVNLNWIEKGGSVAGTSLVDSRLIRWTIAVNAGGYHLTGATITDTIPKDLDLFVDGTHPIQFGTTDLENIAGGGPNTYTVAASGDTDILTVHLGDISAAGTLTFYTRVTNPAVYTGNGTTTFTNSAEFNWTENVSGTPRDSVGVNVGQGVLSKAAGSTVNYNDAVNREINWTVVINRNLIDITNAIFSDTIDAGQEYVAGSFRINDPTVTGPYTGAFNYESGTLTYKFGNTRTISDMYTITYKTRITNDLPLYVNQSGVGFTNTAKLTGTSTSTIDIQAAGTQRYNSQVIDKTVKTGYDHTTKRVTWQIVVNRNSIPLSGAVLSDSIPAGMTFLPETFAVTGVTGAADDALSSTVYPLGDTTSQDSFTYTFPTNYDDTATITYQTQVKEAALLTQGAKSFSNMARLQAGALDASSSATAPMNNTMVTKTMDHTDGADYALWKVVINGEGVEMTNISVSDVLQAGLQVDMDSVVLYPMTQAANGTLTKVSTPVSKSLYAVTYDTATRELVFSMPGTITSPYQLEFMTDITSSPLAVSNTVKLSGYSYTATSIVNNVTINVSESGLGGSGVQGSITIEKVGESNEPLAGAVFTLYDNRGGFVERATTDSTGKVTFGGLPIRTYVLEETTAPTGYLRDENTVRFRMNTAVPNVFYQFPNGKIRADVIVLKTGAENVPLAGAEFTIYDADNQALAVKTTGTDGKATFEDLEYGDYTIVETKAPQGYLHEPKPVSVSVATTEDINLTLPNTLICADAIVHKADQKGKPLAGAEFTIYDKDNKALAVKTTGTDGKAVFENLEYGKYTVVETKAPQGYQLDTKPVSVSIATTDDVNLTITNPLIRADAIVHKTDQNGKPLTGAEFTIYDKDNKALAVKTTGTDGKAVFEDLEYGNYTIAETKAPQGYLREPNPVSVSVATADDVNLTVTNVPYQIPQTGGWLDTWTLLACGGALILAGVVWLIVRRRVHAR